jgi:hypothetical protein
MPKGKKFDAAEKHFEKKEVNGLRKKLKMKIKYNVPQEDEDE